MIPLTIENLRFPFPPGVSHAVQHTGTAPGFLVAFSTVPFNPDDPDVVRDELIDPKTP